MRKATRAKRKQLAKRVSSPERKVSARQVAAYLLEEAVARAEQAG